MHYLKTTSGTGLFIKCTSIIYITTYSHLPNHAHIGYHTHSQIIGGERLYVKINKYGL